MFVVIKVDYVYCFDYDWLEVILGKFVDCVVYWVWFCGVEVDVIVMVVVCVICEVIVCYCGEDLLVIFGILLFG